MLRPIRFAAIAFTLAGPRASLAAQTVPKWTFAVTPYFWMSSLTGDVGLRRLETHVDMSFGDILDVLKFGVMGEGEARYQSYVFGLDGMYVSIGDAKTIAFRGDTGAFALTQRETMLQPTFGYTVGGDAWGVDGLLGIRYWHLGMALDVDRTRRPSNEREGSRGWADATAGVRLHWMPADGFRVTAGGDAGGGGSRGTWQAYAGVGGDPRSWLTLSLAYRGLSVDYGHDDALFDTTTQGLLLAATFRF